jgi:hypothetical protein
MKIQKTSIGANGEHKQSAIYAKKIRRKFKEQEKRLKFKEHSNWPKIRETQKFYLRQKLPKNK